MFQVKAETMSKEINLFLAVLIKKDIKIIPLFFDERIAEIVVECQNLGCNDDVNLLGPRETMMTIEERGYRGRPEGRWREKTVGDADGVRVGR